MLPVLIAVGPFRLYSYALFFLMALILFWFVVWKKGREMHFDETDLFDAAVVIIFWALIGSRLLYILLVDFKGFGLNLLNWLNFFGKPGIWQFGFLCCGAAAAYIQANRRKWDYFNLTDVLAMALTAYQAVMAFGEFLNGSRYGIVANNFLGLRFGNMMDKHLPVQLYEAGLLSLLLWFLIWTEGHYRTFAWYKGSKSEASSGFVSSMYLIGIGVIGFLLTWLKLPYMVWWGVRMDALWVVIYLAIGLILLYKRAGVKTGKYYPAWPLNRAAKPSTADTGGMTEREAKSSANTSRWSSDIFN